MPAPSSRRILVVAPGLPYRILFHDAHGNRQSSPVTSTEDLWDRVWDYNPTKLIAVNTASWTPYIWGGVMALCRHRQTTIIRHRPERSLPNRSQAMGILGLEEPTDESDILAHLLTHLDEMERDALVEKEKVDGTV